MFFLQKIPVRELRTSDKSDIVELAVIMKTGVCPFIVVFYGCLVRDVSAHVQCHASLCTCIDLMHNIRALCEIVDHTHRPRPSYQSEV